MSKFNPLLSILVIDDDAMVKSILVEYLQNMGFQNVFAAKSSEQALHLIQDPKKSIELIISDWEMPEVSGLTLLKAVRNNPHRAAVPFIMVTSQRSMERFKITQAAQWQVSSYIIKPFRQETLKAKIWEVFGWPHVDVA
jgi:two-component system, chemotaxis family, chemotaxis protein CheY